MLSFLEKLAGAFWGFLSRVVGLILPFFSRAGDVRQLGGRGVWWVLHVVAVVAILGVLYWVNTFPGVRELLTAPTVGRIRLIDFWLPILFLLVYLLCWLGWWLWQLLGPEEHQVDFPDIHAAWEEAAQALRQAGIGLTEAPLFLILGRPQGSEAALFQAAELPLVVKQVPANSQDPLHVYADRDAIYVTCAGASLLGRHAELLADKMPYGANGPGGSRLEMGGDEVGGEDDEFKTVRPGQGRAGAQHREIQAILRRVTDEGRELTEEERQRVRALGGMDGTGEVPVFRRSTVSTLKNTPERERYTARLRYLCRLLVRDRRPYCPINGLLLLVPVAGAENDDDAHQTGAICQLDLATARQTLQVQCPLFALVCDLETVPGFREFIRRFPEKERKKRLGQRFPLTPDLNEGVAAADVIESSVHWVCQSLVPTWVYKLFQLERGRDDFATAVQGNASLYRLMGTMLDRYKRLGQIFKRAVTVEQGVPWLFGGCYLAGTGRDAAQEQAFVAGVFRRLIENQSAVSWTPEAVAEDADYHRWATTGYLIMALLSVAGGLLFVYVSWYR
jgi:hypothetical protein